MRAGGFDMFNGQRVEDAHGTNGEPIKNHYMRDFKNAERFKPKNTPVRQKFNGYVNFHFNPEVDLPEVIQNGLDDQLTLSSLIRQSGIPSADIQNRRKNVIFRMIFVKKAPSGVRTRSTSPRRFRDLQTVSITVRPRGPDGF